jgi:hypothetical protein
VPIIPGRHLFLKKNEISSNWVFVLGGGGDVLQKMREEFQRCSPGFVD